MEHEYSHFDSTADREEKDEPAKPVNVYELLRARDGVAGENADGTPDHIEFEWMTTPWSECSQTCGTNGSGYRVSVGGCGLELELF